MRALLLIVFVLLITVSVIGFFYARRALPAGLDFRGRERMIPEKDINFLADITASTSRGERWVKQEIFDEVFERIDKADGFVVMDFFLVNEFAGALPLGDAKSLSARLVETLVAARKQSPRMPIILISDPLNTLYGGLEQPLFEELRANDIEVVVTDLRQLRDSNLIFSPVWRTFFQWWGDPEGDLIPNPIGDGRIGLSAMLELLNFKANHRKTIVTGQKNGDLWGLVASANPHSASALHGNVALSFQGRLAADLLESEEAVYKMTTGSSFPDTIKDLTKKALEIPPQDEAILVGVVLTENSIKKELLEKTNLLGRGDQADLALFYFSDIDLKKAVARAVGRGAKVRLLMDPSKDGFGREKNGIPNRQVGGWLFERGVDVRWYKTTGEQFHSKMALFQYGDKTATLVLGSANWTRRNLNNLNLETAVGITGPRDAEVFSDASDYFSFIWSNRYKRGKEGVPSELVTSVPFEEYRDPSKMRKILYWVMEKTGASTF